MTTHLFGAVEESISDIPTHAIAHGEAPRQRGLVEVDEQAGGEVAEQHVLVVEARAGQPKIRGEPGQEEGQVAEARNQGHEGHVGRTRVGDQQWHLQVPEGLRYCRCSGAHLL